VEIRQEGAHAAPTIVEVIDVDRVGIETEPTCGTLFGAGKTSATTLPTPLEGIEEMVRLNVDKDVVRILPSRNAGKTCLHVPQEPPQQLGYSRHIGIEGGQG
jgi:hypothetical protein